LALIINIETSTKTCSVCIAKNGKLIDIIEIKSEKYMHSEKLHVLIQNILTKNRLSLDQLDAIGVCKGPGSFTGLRIGVSAAKGMAYALKKPLVSCYTNDLMMENYSITNISNKALYLTMIDARREEVYMGAYNFQKTRVSPITAQVINEEYVNEILLDNNEVVFLGEGARKFKAKFKNKNLLIHDQDLTSASGMVKLTYEKYMTKSFEDVAYFNPFYLKDFQPHKKNN